MKTLQPTYITEYDQNGNYLSHHSANPNLENHNSSLSSKEIMLLVHCEKEILDLSKTNKDRFLLLNKRCNNF